MTDRKKIFFGVLLFLAIYGFALPFLSATVFLYVSSWSGADPLNLKVDDLESSLVVSFLATLAFSPYHFVYGVMASLVANGVNHQFLFKMSPAMSSCSRFALGVLLTAFPCVLWSSLFQLGVWNLTLMITIGFVGSCMGVIHVILLDVTSPSQMEMSNEMN